MSLHLCYSSRSDFILRIRQGFTADFNQIKRSARSNVQLINIFKENSFEMIEHRGVKCSTALTPSDKTLNRSFHTVTLPAHLLWLLDVDAASCVHASAAPAPNRTTHSCVLVPRLSLGPASVQPQPERLGNIGDQTAPSASLKRSGALPFHSGSRKHRNWNNGV